MSKSASRTQPITRPSRKAAVLFAATAVAMAAFGAGRADAAYPGANGKIAFENTAPLISQDIFTVNPDGSDATNLTSTGRVDFEPAYSADGKLIAFASDRRGGQMDIYMMRSDGSRVQRLTGGNGEDRDPYFAPDGKSVVFERSDAGGVDSEIFSVRSNGKGLVNLTKSPATFDSDPAYSPNGKKIVFISNRTSSPLFGSTYNVLTMDADGSNQAIVVATFMAHESDPDFSPNGKQIVFARDGDGNGFPDDVYVAKANSFNAVTNLTKTFGATEDEWHPSFSPDGKRIVYLSGDADLSDGDVFTMSAKGAGVKPVYRKGQSTAPNWGPLP